MLSFKEFIEEDKSPSRLKAHDAIKILTAKGYYLVRKGKGSHDVYAHNDPAKPHFALPKHASRELSPGVTRQLFALPD